MCRAPKMSKTYKPNSNIVIFSETPEWRSATFMARVYGFFKGFRLLAKEPSQQCVHSEQGEPSDSELSQHASLISWQRMSMVMWQPRRPAPAPNPRERAAQPRLTGPAR